MGYRNATEAARRKMDAALERAAEREELLTPRLERELPRRLRDKLAAARDEAMREAHELEAIRAREQALDRYRGVIDEALSRAPRIDRRINRLPHSFPARLRPHHRYIFPDVYSSAVQDMRRRLHRSVRRIDPKASFADERKRYFDTLLDPYMVEGLFHFERAPLRLHVVVWYMESGHTATPPNTMLAGFSLLTRLRKSAPSLKLEPEAWHRSVLKKLRLKKDVVIGNTPLDERFVINGDRDAIRRLLTPAISDALVSLALVDVPTLEIDDGVARLEWRELGRDGDGLVPACTVLSELRKMPPAPLLATRGLSERRAR